MLKVEHHRRCGVGCDLHHSWVLLPIFRDNCICFIGYHRLCLSANLLYCALIVLLYLYMKFNKVYLNFVLVILGLGIVYFMAVAVVPGMLVTLTKAAPALNVSISNSYFMGGKMLAKADGKDTVIVNAFALDASGKGVINKSVEVTGKGDEVFNGVTDADGKASFEIASTVEGQFKLSATIDGIPIERMVIVTFRN